MAPTQNIDPDANDAYLVYIPAGVFFVISPLMVGLRLWSRVRQGGKMGADDYAVIVALIFTQLLSAFLVASCHFGMGRHLQVLTPEEKKSTLMYFWLAQVAYKAAINLVKVCILLLYLRIFTTIRWFRICCIILLAAVFAYCIAALFATIFQCWPIQRAFNKEVAGHCVNNSQFWYANAGFSISTDIIILLLPMRLVYQLQIPISQKIALIAVFAVGTFVVITSCLRITTLNILATTPDTTYDISNVMWTIVEPNVAVVCACLPILRHFIAKLIPGLRAKGYSNQYATPPHGSKISRKHVTQSGDTNRWVEIGTKSDSIHMATIQRNNSETAGSQESILAEDGRGKAPAGIKKTVEYTIQYSRE